MKRLLALIAACSIFTGCATVNPMAFDKKSSSIDTSSKSIVLLTIDVSRADDSRYEPKPMVVKLEKPGAQSKEDRQNYKLTKEEDSVLENGHTIYLARMAIAPGQYKLDEVWGMAKAFPFVGSFIVPVYSDVTIKPNSITYIGRVSAKLRPRKGNEFRAGPALPIIDQAVTGLSSGTWDIAIDDMSTEDIALFRANYPALKSSNIDTTLLPEFDRVAVQKLWDAQPNDDKKTQATAAASAPANTVTSSTTTASTSSN